MYIPDFKIKPLIPPYRNTPRIPPYRTDAVIETPNGLPKLQKHRHRYRESSVRHESARLKPLHPDLDTPLRTWILSERSPVHLRHLDMRKWWSLHERDRYLERMHRWQQQDLNHYRLKKHRLLEGYRPVSECLNAGLAYQMIPNLLGYGGHAWRSASWRPVSRTPLVSHLR